MWTWFTFRNKASEPGNELGYDLSRVTVERDDDITEDVPVVKLSFILDDGDDEAAKYIEVAIPIHIWSGLEAMVRELRQSTNLQRVDIQRD